MVAVDREGMSVLYNLKGEFVIAHFNFKAPVKALCFSPDGKLLAVGIDRGFRIYESPPFLRTFEPLLLLKKYKNRHTGTLTSMSFTPDSRFLITSGN
jgi:periodic tryptophan protein 2